MSWVLFIFAILMSVNSIVYAKRSMSRYDTGYFIFASLAFMALATYITYAHIGGF